MVFMLLLALSVPRQGVHLSANPLGHPLEQMAGSGVSILMGFYHDEALSNHP